MESQEEQGFNFGKFQHRLGLYNFNPGQNAMLDTRLDLLQDFMQPTNINLSKTSKKPDFRHTKDGKEKERIWENNEHQKRQAAMVRKGTWSFEPGSLTIVVSGILYCIPANGCRPLHNTVLPPKLSSDTAFVRETVIGG